MRFCQTEEKHGARKTSATAVRGFEPENTVVPYRGDISEESCQGCANELSKFKHLGTTGIDLSVACSKPKLSVSDNIHYSAIVWVSRAAVE